MASLWGMDGSRRRRRRRRNVYQQHPELNDDQQQHQEQQQQQFAEIPGEKKITPGEKNLIGSSSKLDNRKKMNQLGDQSSATIYSASPTFASSVSSNSSTELVLVSKFSTLASQHIRQAEYPQAIRCYQRALEEYEQDRSGLISLCNAAATCFNLGALHKKLQDYRGAVHYFKQAEHIYRDCLLVSGTSNATSTLPSQSVPTSVCIIQLIVETLQTRAHVHWKYQQLAVSSMECHEEVVKLLDQGEEDVASYTYNDQPAQVFLPQHQVVVVSISQTQRAEMLSQSLHQLGKLYIHQGLMDDGLGAYQEALIYLRQLEAHGDKSQQAQHQQSMAAILKSLSEIYMGQNQVDRAVDALHDAMDLKQPTRSGTADLMPEYYDPQTLDAMTKIGLANEQMGNLDKASSCYEKVLLVQSQCLGPYHLHVAESLIRLGRIMELQGNPEGGLDLYQAAYSIYGQHQDEYQQMQVQVQQSPPAQSSAIDNDNSSGLSSTFVRIPFQLIQRIAHILMTQGQYKDVIEFLTDSMSDLPKKHVAFGYRELGKAYMEIKEFEKANHCLLESAKYDGSTDEQVFSLLQRVEFLQRMDDSVSSNNDSCNLLMLDNGTSHDISAMVILEEENEDDDEDNDSNCDGGGDGDGVNSYDNDQQENLDDGHGVHNNGHNVFSNDLNKMQTIEQHDESQEDVQNIAFLDQTDFSSPAKEPATTEPSTDDFDLNQTDKPSTPYGREGDDILIVVQQNGSHEIPMQRRNSSASTLGLYGMKSPRNVSLADVSDGSDESDGNDIQLHDEPQMFSSFPTQQSRPPLVQSVCPATTANTMTTNQSVLTDVSTEEDEDGNGKYSFSLEAQISTDVDEANNNRQYRYPPSPLEREAPALADQADEEEEEEEEENRGRDSDNNHDIHSQMPQSVTATPSNSASDHDHHQLSFVSDLNEARDGNSGNRNQITSNNKSTRKDVVNRLIHAKLTSSKDITRGNQLTPNSRDETRRRHQYHPPEDLLTMEQELEAIAKNNRVLFGDEGIPSPSRITTQDLDYGGDDNSTLLHFRETLSNTSSTSSSSAASVTLLKAALGDGFVSAEQRVGANSGPSTSLSKIPSSDDVIVRVGDWQKEEEKKDDGSLDGNEVAMVKDCGERSNDEVIPATLDQKFLNTTMLNCPDNDREDDNNCAEQDETILIPKIDRTGVVNFIGTKSTETTELSSDCGHLTRSGSVDPDNDGKGKLTAHLSIASSSFPSQTLACASGEVVGELLADVGSRSSFENNSVASFDEEEDKDSIKSSSSSTLSRVIALSSASDEQEEKEIQMNINWKNHDSEGESLRRKIDFGKKDAVKSPSKTRGVTVQERQLALFQAETARRNKRPRDKPLSYDGMKTPNNSFVETNKTKSAFTETPISGESVNRLSSSESESSRTGLLSQEPRDSKQLAAKNLKMPTLSPRHQRKDLPKASPRHRFVKAISSPFRRNKRKGNTTSNLAVFDESRELKDENLQSTSQPSHQPQDGATSNQLTHILPQAQRQNDQRGATSPIKRDAPISFISARSNSWGDDAVSQITFAVENATSQQSDQEGQWWWGVTAEGLEGWFPSSYVHQAVEAAAGFLSSKDVHERGSKSRPLDYDSEEDSDKQDDEAKDISSPTKSAKSPALSKGKSLDTSFGKKSTSNSDRLGSVNAVSSTNGEIVASVGTEILEMVTRMEKIKSEQGPESDTVAKILFDLSILHARNKDKSAAMECIVQCVQMNKSLSNHAEAARALHFLADVYSREKKYKSALNCYSEAQRLQETTFGYFHEEIANTLNRIGNVLARQGNFDSAMENHKKALRILKECFGEEVKHPMVSQTLIQIGAVYYKERNSLATIQANVDGYSTFIEGGMLEIIGRAHEDRGSYRMAIAFFEEKLQFLDSKDGSKELEQVAETLNSLGMLSCRAGLFMEAIDYYDKALEIQMKLGCGEVQLAMARVLTGTVQFHLGHFRKALKLFQDAISILRSNVGHQHQTVAATLYQIGVVRASLCEYDVAMDALHEALSIQNRKLGDDHPATLRTMREIGNMYAIYESELDSAFEQFDAVLDTQTRVHGEKHPNVAETLHSLGCAYIRKGNYETALKLFEDSYNMRLEFLGMDHPLQATTLHEIAKIHLHRGRLKKAIHIIDAVLNIRRESLSEQHIDVATALATKASCLVVRGSFNDATKLFIESLPMAEQAVGDAHPSVADIHVQRGIMYLRKCHFDEARCTIQKALDIYRSANLDEDHPGIRLAVSELDRVERAEMLCV